MSRVRSLVSTGLASGLLVASGLVMAQEVRSTDAGTATPTRRVSQILGSSVRLQGSGDYGKVEDIVLNEDGYVEYLVVSREDRYAMLPWGVARVDYGQRAVIYDVPPQTVQPLFFARDALPSVSDPAYGRRMQETFGPRAVRREIRRTEREGVPADPAARPEGRRRPEVEPKAVAPERRPTPESEPPPARPRADRPADRPKAEQPPDRPRVEPPADRPKAEPPTRPRAERDQPQPPPAPVEPRPQPTPKPAQP